MRLWDTGTGDAFKVFQYTFDITSFAYSPDGRTIASGGQLDTTGTVQKVNTRAGHLGLVLRSDTGICCVTFSTDGRWVVTGDKGGVLYRWETIQTRRSKAGLCWKGHRSKVSRIDFSPNGLLLASSGCDKMIKLWNAESGSLVSIFKGPVVDFAFSSDGSQLVSCGWDMTVRLWALTAANTGPNYYGSIGSASGVTYSPDGRYIIYGSNDGAIRSYDEVTGQSSQVLPPGSYHDKGTVFRRMVFELRQLREAAV